MARPGQITFMGSRATVLKPKLPSRYYKTYEVAAPLDTHFRRADCAEFECDAYREGWTYKKADLIAADLYDLVTHAGKRYKEMSLDDSSDIYVVFEPGQMCFQAASHRIPLQRPELFFSGRGDFRTFSQRRANQFDNAEQWAESFAEHQDIINRVVEEGL